ncbi:MAG TPA: polysaccharide biosynthesis/export family protein [Terriglobales bacterium]|nr:polysaccharide biosynthesis/export family protein [Terriglobales bacterium]
MRICIVVLLSICLSAAWAQTASQNPTTTPAATATSPVFAERTPRYLLRSGDVLDISFELSPELNQEISIQPDGFVTLREAGDLHASGESLPEFREAVKNAYGKSLNHPIITVVLKDFEKPYFTAGGMIAHPGKYEMRGDITLVEALEQAGGFTEESKHSQVLLFRRVSHDWLQAKVIDVKKMLKDKSLAEDIHLQPGDLIFVPQNSISKIRKFIPASGFNVNSPVM